MDNELLDGFRLSDVRIEPLTGTVIRDGTTTHLPSKATEVLLWLARNPRHIATREELLERVWGHGHGSNEALTHAITEIRHALGDTPHDPRFIQTVPTRGYRLLVTPDVEGQQPESPAIEVREPDSSDRSFWQKLVRHGVVQAAVAYTVIGWGLIQVAGETFENLGLPAWTVPFVTFVVVGGFPVMILLAWFLEMTEGKMVLDEGQYDGGLWEGLGRNYLAIVAAYVIAAFGTTVYQVSVGFPVPESAIPVEHLNAAADASNEDDLIPVADNSIAVLKFVNFDGTEQTQVFANGLSEDILDRVARVPGLLVAARGDAWSMPENASSQEVRRRLRVAYYLEGSVRIQEDQILVVAQLIDSATGFHIVSKPVERGLAEFIEIQSEITDLIVAELRVALPEDIQSYVAVPSDESDVDAYVQFRLGKDIMNAPRTLESIEEAASHFRKALEIDPEYAAAHAGLCTSYTARFQIAGSQSDLQEAERSCQTALATAPRLALVHRAGGSFFYRSGRMAEAERAYRDAIELDPQDADAMLGLSRVMRRTQRPDQAEALIVRAIELKPGNWNAYNALGALQFSTGKFAEAAETYRRVEFLQPDNFIALGNMATAQMMAGDFESSRDTFERTLEIRATPRVLSNLGVLYYYLGEFERSIGFHRQSVDLTPNAAHAWINLGDSLHFAGLQDEARAAFEKGATLAEEQYRNDPSNAEVLTYLAWARTMTGGLDDGRWYANRAIEVAPDDPYSYYYRALVALQADDPDRAMTAIHKAAELGYSRVMLNAEPYLAPLRERDDYVALVSKKQGDE